MSAQAAYQAALAQQLVGPPLASGGAGPYGPMGMGYGGPQGALAAQVAAQLAMQQGYYPGPNINAAAAAAAAAAVQNMMGARLFPACGLRLLRCARACCCDLQIIKAAFEECSAAGGGGLLGDRDYDGKRRGDRRGNRLRRDIERERERELEDAAGHFSSRFQSLEEVLGQV